MELLRDARSDPGADHPGVLEEQRPGASASTRTSGTLAKGKAADLLVLARNPLDDIANMRSFEAVYLGGRNTE